MITNWVIVIALALAWMLVLTVVGKSVGMRTSVFYILLVIGCFLIGWLVA